MTALSSATIGIDERSWSQPRSSVGAGRERLLDQLHAERDELGEQPLGVVAGPASVGVDPDGAVEDLADGSSVARSCGPPHLILSAGKSAARRGPLGDDRTARRCRW